MTATPPGSESDDRDVASQRSEWPWPEVRRDTGYTIGGDIEAFTRLGLFADEAATFRLVSLVMAGVPELDGYKVALNEGIRGRELTLDIDGPGAKYAQRFVSQDAGWAVSHDLMVLSEPFQGKGYSQKLIKNLLLLYDELRIRHVSVYAGHSVGGYAWAALGARPLDCQAQRGLLAARLSKLVGRGQIPSEYEESFLELINTTEENLLMRNIAAVETPDGRPIGRTLLLGHEWEAFWDLADTSLRSYLKGRLA